MIGAEQRLVDNQLNMLTSLKKEKLKASALIVVTLLLICTLTYVSGKQKVILYNQNMPSGVSVWKGGASDDYKSAIAYSDVTTYFNYTPSRIHETSERFLKRLVGSVYGKTRNALIEREKNIKSGDFSQVFYFDRASVVENTNTVKVYGELKQFSGEKVFKHKSIVVKINYRFDNGYALIEGWSYE